MALNFAGGVSRSEKFRARIENERLRNSIFNIELLRPNHKDKNATLLPKDRDIVPVLRITSPSLKQRDDHPSSLLEKFPQEVRN